MSVASTLLSVHAPRPGFHLGLYPQRSDAVAPWRAPGWAHALQVLLRAARPAAPAPDLAPVRQQQARWLTLTPDQWPAALQALRARLAREGLGGPASQEALGCASAALQITRGLEPFDTQLQCAQALLGGALAEMATGEGKTIAVALAAMVAALAGVPVHAMTANDYLAQRDAQALAPVCERLGLSCAVVLSSTPPDERRCAYASDICFCTAREVAFDHLRDRQVLRTRGGDLQRRAAALAGDAPPALLLRGLCMALVDEADSLLIDEATTPLVLAETVDDPAQRAACFQALALARQIQPGVDVHIEALSHAVLWSAAGEDRLETLAAALGGAWLNRRHRNDLVASALVALHALQRDHDYLVREGRVELLDGVTGRSAQGRVWARGLQSMVELKEACAITPATRTVAQTSFQRFFTGYWHLAGTSGTLGECTAELAAVYGKAVVHIARRAPCRRQQLEMRAWPDSAARHAQVLRRVQEFTALGRPVLVGCASVAAARALSQVLAEGAIDHAVLDATQDAQEAQIVARAGQPGAVTVATAMAGRGTDIELGPGVAALGGLHVIDCQDSANARLVRQLCGRAARQGEPGSAEVWLALDAKAWREGPGSSWLHNGRNQTGVKGAFGAGRGLRLWTRWAQWAEQQRGMQQRRRLLEQDLAWQTQLEFSRLRA